MNNSIATFTVSDDYMDREYQHINISLVYNYENNLDESTIALKLERFLKERHIDCKYTLMDDIIDILYTGGYEIKIVLPFGITKYIFHNCRVRIITVNEEHSEDCKSHKINITYRLFVHIYRKATLHGLYGVSNMYPASLIKSDITIHHDPTRVLGHIDKSAHTTPKKVICSGPVTTVIFEDGTKSQVRCSKDDEGYNDYEKAFMMAWLYQLAGKKNVRKVLKENQDIFGDSEETNSIVNALNNIRFMFNGRKG